MNPLSSVQTALMLEIAQSSVDCHLNHKVSKAALKGLIAMDLIQVETRRCSAWKNEPEIPSFTSAQDRVRFWEGWGAAQRRLLWQDRSEIHARLLSAGYAWHTEYLRSQQAHEV